MLKINEIFVVSSYIIDYLFIGIIFIIFHSSCFSFKLLISEQIQTTLPLSLGEQIVNDFEQMMMGGGGVGISGNKQLAEACLVVLVLEPRIKRNLISWFVQLQLKNTILFAVGEDEAWLDRLDSRYNWLKKHLIEFEERSGPLFPPD